MGRAVDVLHDACTELINDPKLYHDETYMMHLFDDIADEIPEFKDFLQYKYEDQVTTFVATSNSKSVPYKMLISDLFHPRDEDNKASTSMLEKIAKIGIEAFKVELEDENKATRKYLSS